MRRLLYVTPSSFTLLHHLMGELAWLRDRGFEIEVASAPDARAAEAARAGVRVYGVRIEQNPAPVADALAFVRLTALLRHGAYDLLIASTKKGMFLTGLAARLARCRSRVVYVLRGLSIGRVGPSKMRVFRAVERLNCSLADRVLFYSDSNRDLFVTRGCCPLDKACVLAGGSGRGVDTTLFRLSPETLNEAGKLRRTFAIPHNAFVLGYVGRLLREKGIVELAGAWTVLRERFPSAHLVIAGPPESDPGATDGLALLKSDPRVRFTGFLADPIPIYAAINCLVLPSYSEGFPNVILEAGAMEVPVIATRVTGCVDAVVPGETGLLIPPRSSGALADAATQLVNNPDWARTLGRNGRRRVLEKFRQELVWNERANFYSQLTQELT